MNLWAIFWGAWLIVAGTAFVLITVVVAIKGMGDLRKMLRGLSLKK